MIEEWAIVVKCEGLPPDTPFLADENGDTVIAESRFEAIRFARAYMLLALIPVMAGGAVMFLVPRDKVLWMKPMQLK